MKKLVTAADVRNMSGSGQKVIYLDRSTIITPAARDLVYEIGMSIQKGPSNTEPAAKGRQQPSWRRQPRRTQ